MSMFARVCALLLLASAAPTLAQTAQAPSIVVPAGQPFVHAHSGLSIPATLADLPRTAVQELDAPQLDVMANYKTADSGESLTVYVYRSTAGGVPVWFDRAVWQVENRPVYGTPTRLGIAPAFVPPGQSVASGMIGVWNVTGEYRGTALALLPVGEWLVKFRYSSVTHDAAALEPRLRAVIAALGWPGAIPAAPAAAPVAPCAEPIAFKGEAKPVRTKGGASALFGGLLAGITPKPGAPPSTIVWCSDPAPVASGAIYRADNARDAYLLALSDAGRGVQVGPDTLAALVEKSSRPRWSINLVLPGTVVNYPAFDRLPAPDRVLAALSGPPLSRTTTWGGKRDITIAPGALK